MTTRSRHEAHRRPMLVFVTATRQVPILLVSERFAEACKPIF